MEFYSGTTWFILLLSFFHSVFSLWACSNLVQALVNLFPSAVSLLFNGLFVQNSLYLFHTRSTAEGFLYFRELSAAVEGGLEGKDWRHFHTVSHLRIATRLLCLFYHLSFIHISLLFLLHSYCTLFFSFLIAYLFSLSFLSYILWAQITATDINMQCNFPPFLIIENLRSAQLGTFINVSASQPLSSTRWDTKCQPLSSVTVFVNYSHLEMSMSKPQWERKDSWKAESTAHSSPL